MLQVIRGVVHDGNIELNESVDLPEGAGVLVTLLPEDENAFWSQISEQSLAAVWSNTEDDGYAELLHG